MFRVVNRRPIGLTSRAQQDTYHTGPPATLGEIPSTTESPMNLKFVTVLVCNCEIEISTKTLYENERFGLFKATLCKADG